MKKIIIILVIITLLALVFATAHKPLKCRGGWKHCKPTPTPTATEQPGEIMPPFEVTGTVEYRCFLLGGCD